MSILSNISLSRKIPLLIGCIALVSVAATSFLSLSKAENELLEQNANQLTSLIAARAYSLESYLGSIKEDLTTLATSEQANLAVGAFAKAYRDLGPNAGQMLQAAYIHDNPNPLGEKHKLDRATENTLYNQFMHASIHGSGNSLKHVAIMIFSCLPLRGTLSIQSSRSRIMRPIFRSANGEIPILPRSSFPPNPAWAMEKSSMSDFRPYSPSNDAPASFIATPILNKGKIAGVLAFQMPVGRINHFMQERDGLGESGETYLVGADKLMRSDSRFSSERTLLERAVDTDSARAALDNQTGVMETTGL